MATKSVAPTNENLNWYVIYTKAKQEKKVAQQLKKNEIEAYCPTRIVTSQWSDRLKKIEKPLFTSYCFVRLSANNLNAIYKAQGIVRYVYWCGKPAIVNDKEIDEIKRWLNDFNHDEIEVINYEHNQQILINSGVFINQKAKIINQNGRNLTLILNSLGIKLSVKINEISIKKAN